VASIVVAKSESSCCSSMLKSEMLPISIKMSRVSVVIMKRRYSMYLRSRILHCVSVVLDLLWQACCFPNLGFKGISILEIETLPYIKV
jgi:hypothetical protein